VACLARQAELDGSAAFLKALTAGGADQGMSSCRRRDEGERKNVSDAEFRELIKRAMARGQEQSAEPRPEAEQPPEGKVFDLGLRRGSLKLEQNLGCELPVCVASNHDTKQLFIEVETDEGVIWRLTREAGGYLPAPYHYPYWLWFLDRCQAAAERGLTEPPKVLINPVEIFDLFGAPQKTKRNGYHGSRYDALDSAFERFSSLRIHKRAGFFDGKRTYSGKGSLGTLCYYVSWRMGADERQQTLEFAKAYVQPGPLLWASIQAGYLKSVPLEPIKHLTYVEQRLLTYLAKHCRPGGRFAVSPTKLLPKIPIECRPSMLKSRLGPRHEALAKAGFLQDARVEGRGKNRLLVYERSSRAFPPPPVRAIDAPPLLK
jgi:hypothetical protein